MSLNLKERIAALLIEFFCKVVASFSVRYIDSDHDTVLLVGLVYFGDGVDEAGVSETQVFLNRILPVFFHSSAHDFFKSRVHDINFVGTLEVVLQIIVSHHFEKPLLRLLLVFLCHFSGGDMLDVFEPLEVRAGDTTAVDEHVGGDNDASLGQDLFSGEGRGPVGSLEYGLNLDVSSVAHVDGLLRGGRDHSIGREFSDE